MNDTATSIYNSKIVIIDDNESNVAVLEMALEDDGYEDIHTFTNPLAGLAFCKAEPIDLILLDIRMPEMDGLQLMAELNDKLQSEFLPVIVLTSDSSEEAHTGALNAGAHDFLTKPFKQYEVLLRIKNVLTTRTFYKAAMRPIG